jgi:hypothetical protein
MIVTSTPDVVLDVLEAADPVAQREATVKLNALKSSDADSAASFDSQVDKAKATATAVDDQLSAKMVQADIGALNAAAPVRVIKAPSSSDVYRKFEAFVLQVFVDSMLPKDSQDVFGKGTAGGIWRSMLAEQLGNQLAQGKGVGIAKQLAAAHPAPRGDPAKVG